MSAHTCPHTSIVIVSYRCPEDIRDCLTGLACSTFRDFDVHVCENGGAEAYRQLVDELGRGVLCGVEAVDGQGRSATILESRAGRLGPGGPMVHLHLASGNLGYSGGVNACLRWIADRPWQAIWVLNPDTEPDERALEALLARAAEGGYGIVGSRLVLKEGRRIHLYGGVWRRWMARGYNLGRGLPEDAEADTPAIERALDYVAGTSMLVTRDYIERIGEMDERYFLYHEEVDWCLRRGAARLGYAHDSIVYHKHGATMGSSSDRKRRSRLSVYLEERNKLLLTRRFYPAIYPVVVLTTLVLTAQYLRAGAFANFRTALAGWSAGLRGETGAPRWYRT